MEHQELVDDIVADFNFARQKTKTDAHKFVTQFTLSNLDADFDAIHDGQDGTQFIPTKSKNDNAGT